MSGKRVKVVGRREEQGYAMVISVVVASVAIVLVSAILAQGLHLLQATTRDRRWNNALQVAEAGIERTVVELIRDPSAGGMSVTTVPYGQFESTVVTPAVGYRTITSTGYVPSKGATNAVARRITVRYGPAPVFQYALFSASTMELKNVNNNCVRGDAFANESIAVSNNACIEGSILSATGAVAFENNADVKRKADGTGGDVHSGGLGTTGSADWGIATTNGVRIQGSAHATQASCPAPDPTKYKIIGDGLIEGDAWAGNTITPTVVGTKEEHVCRLSRPTQLLPTFQVGQIQSLYGTPVTEYNSVASFLAANPGTLSGYHYVNDATPGATVNLTGRTVTDTFVLITNALIDFNLNFVVDMAVNSPDKFVDIISLNSSTDPTAPAINIVNGFEVRGSPKPPVLLYSTGLVEVKNSAISNGAVYGNRVNIKNNLDMTYDGRVERVLGFGASRFERISWNEVPVT